MSVRTTFFALAAAAALLSGCNFNSYVYRPDVHKNRWDYTYYMNPRRGNIELRHVTVVFDDEGRLTAVEHDPLPSEQEADKAILGAKAK